MHSTRGTLSACPVHPLPRSRHPQVNRPATARAPGRVPSAQTQRQRHRAAQGGPPPLPGARWRSTQKAAWQGCGWGPPLRRGGSGCVAVRSSCHQGPAGVGQAAHPGSSEPLVDDGSHRPCMRCLLVCRGRLGCHLQFLLATSLAVSQTLPAAVPRLHPLQNAEPGPKWWPARGKGREPGAKSGSWQVAEQLCLDLQARPCSRRPNPCAGQLRDPGVPETKETRAWVVPLSHSSPQLEG